MAGRGSTPLLNDMVEALILDALGRGAVPSEAARHGGVDPRTLRRWCQRGREAEARAVEGVELTDVEERMRAFNERVEQARMTARLRAVDRIQNALTHEEVCLTPWAVLPNGHHPILDPVGAIVDGHTVAAQCAHKVIVADWKAAAWYLERVDPAAWGRVQRPDARPDDDADADLDDDTEIERHIDTLLSSIFPGLHTPGAVAAGGEPDDT